MRRKDREVTDPRKIFDIISACHCCRLGFCDNGRAYIVPLNFGFTEENGSYIFYFHGAKKGRKIDLIRETGYGSFEMDTNYRLNGDGEACEYSARFQCVMGEGPVTFVEETEEKKAALQAVMEHYTQKGDWEFADKILEATCIFRLEVKKLSCKEHL